MEVLFLDESGDHNLTQAVTDTAQYPIFVLAGIIVDQLYADTVLEERINNFKRKMFGREDIILHTSDIMRNRKGFEALIDREFNRSRIPSTILQSPERVDEPTRVSGCSVCN